MGNTEEEFSDVSPAGFLPSAQEQMVSPQHLPAVLVLHRGIAVLSCGIWRDRKFHGREAHFSLCFIVPELTFSILVTILFSFTSSNSVNTAVKISIILVTKTGKEP